VFGDLWSGKKSRVLPKKGQGLIAGIPLVVWGGYLYFFFSPLFFLGSIHFFIELIFSLPLRRMFF